MAMRVYLVHENVLEGGPSRDDLGIPQAKCVNTIPSQTFFHDKVICGIGINLLVSSDAWKRKESRPSLHNDVIES